MGKILNYKLLGTALKSLSDACFKADDLLKDKDGVYDIREYFLK